jgi:hypothetical protein
MMGAICRMDERNTCKLFSWENKRLRDIGIDGRIILKWILEKQVVNV